MLIYLQNKDLLCWLFFCFTDKCPYADIISLEKVSSDWKAYRLHYIQDHPFPNHKLTKEHLDIKSEEHVIRDFQETLSKKISTGVFCINVLVFDKQL